MPLHEPKRNEVEREADRVFVAGLVLQAGPDVNAIQVWKVLNHRREERARKAAAEAGKSPAEIKLAGIAARVGVHTVRRDINAIKARVQDAGMAGAALFLDDQISAVRDEIEQTHEMDEQIMLDLERSRGVSWTRTKGKKAEKTGKIEAAEVVRHKVEDGAGQAALWARIQENARRRSELRAEERLLRFGRQSVPEPTGDEELTFAELVMDIDDPAKARAAALKLLRRELLDLASASRQPLAGDMVRLEALRVKALETRIRSLRDYLRLDDGEDGEAVSFEQAFIEIPVRQLPAAPSTEMES